MGVNMNVYDNVANFVVMICTDDPAIFNRAYKNITGRPGKGVWSYMSEEYRLRRNGYYKKSCQKKDKTKVLK